jgi:hypothetical protein
MATPVAGLLANEELAATADVADRTRLPASRRPEKLSPMQAPQPPFSHLRQIG